MLETRADEDEKRVVRRRSCIKCRARVTTWEAAVAAWSTETPRPGRPASPSKNNAVGMKVRTEARRKLEERREMEQYEETFSVADLRRELGW